MILPHGTAKSDPTDSGPGIPPINWEVGLTDIQGLITDYTKTPESRLGLEGKWDVGIGLWFEGTCISKSKNIGKYSNQQIFTTGLDYTFNIGNGLNVIGEYMLYAANQNAFDLSNMLFFTALSANYPIGLSDNIQFHHLL